MWSGSPASGSVGVDGDVQVLSLHNLLLGNVTSTGSGQRVAVLEEVVTAPVSLAALNAVVLYCQSGHLKAMTADGAVTVVASRS